MAELADALDSGSNVIPNHHTEENRMIAGFSGLKFLLMQGIWSNKLASFSIRQFHMRIWRNWQTR